MGQSHDDDHQLIERIWIGVAGLSGAAAVAADAVARHLLAGDAYRLDLAATGARYGLSHALALLATAILRRGLPLAAPAHWLGLAGWCFAAGLLLFSGSLYVLAAGGPVMVGPLTPVGGVLLIAGWVALLAAALALPRG